METTGDTYSEEEVSQVREFIIEEMDKQTNGLRQREENKQASGVAAWAYVCVPAADRVNKQVRNQEYESLRVLRHALEVLDTGTPELEFNIVMQEYAAARQEATTATAEAEAKEKWKEL